MRIELREDEVADVWFDPQKGDRRQVIVSRKYDDVRICDGRHVVKITFKENPDGRGKVIDGVLVDDIFVTRHLGGELEPYPL